ncbi:LuxR family transcriptional regulator [Pandoraea fibrosis]|uniref:LuxR family transcriptional regulator n=2 Tax=Pandoraea fibrosis TaxID=1891094 RepID=A0A5E4YWE9_9BURK|nr:LuxR family transcriptional regulator [Pandoraea fibrosis]
MINVGVLANNHVVMTAVRGVLASSADVNVMHLRDLAFPETVIKHSDDVDVLLCEPVSLRVLNKVRAKFHRAGSKSIMRVLFLGMPPAERTLRKFIQSGVFGFVGITAADFVAMPEAIRAVASGEFYFPSMARIGDGSIGGCR